MTIVSSASTHRWTNRESLHKDKDSWNKDSCRKDKQNSRFPVRILPTHYEAHTSSYEASRVAAWPGMLALAWDLKFRIIQLWPIRIYRIGWRNPSGRKVKAFLFYATVRDARGMLGGT